MTEIEIQGLKELEGKLSKAPGDVNQAMHNAMGQSLLTLWENVPPYPPKPPESTYRRTLTLGGSLGSSAGGGAGGGKPSVYTIKGSGTNIQGRFGTNLTYARYVIDPQRQAYMHRPGYKGRQGWWTMDTIKQRAEEKIKSLWNKTISLIMKKLGL